MERQWLGGRQLTWPSVALWPDFAPCLTELRRKVPDAAQLRIASGASLEIRGRDILIEALDVEGALRVEVADGASLRIARLRVRNRGHEFVALTEDEQAGAASEELRIRGYRLVRHETHEIVISEPGAYVLTDTDLARTSS